MRGLCLLVVLLLSGCLSAQDAQPETEIEDPEPIGNTGTNEPSSQQPPKPPAINSDWAPPIKNAQVQAIWDDLQDGLVQLVVTDTRSELPEQIYGGGIRIRDTLEVSLRVSAWQSNATVPLIEHGDPTELWWATWSGDATEDPSLARIVLTETWARASVRLDHKLYRAYIGDIPEPRDDRILPVGPIEFLEVSEQPSNRSAEGCENQRPSVAPLGPGPVHFEGQRLHGSMAYDIDDDFSYKWGETAVVQAVAFAVENDMIFDDQVGVRLHIAGLHIAPPGAYPPSGPSTPLGDLQVHWVEHALPRGAVMLLQPMQQQAAANGQVTCGGSFGSPAEAYAHAFTQTAGVIEYDLNHLNTVAHETGHLFFASHADGDPEEGRAGTIMPGTTPNGPFNDVSTIFSAQTRPVVRATAENVLGFRNV